MKTFTVATATALGMILAAHANSSYANDQEFVNKAAKGGMMEVALGHTAANQGSSQGVKDFGQRMVTDHSKANDELKTAATADGLNVPSAPSSMQESMMKKLEAKQGADFDKAYTKDMVKDHKEDIKLFEKEAKSGTSSHVKEFAQQTLPTLRDHLKNIEEVRSNMGTSSMENSKMHDSNMKDSSKKD